MSTVAWFTYPDARRDLGGACQKRHLVPFLFPKVDLVPAGLPCACHRDKVGIFGLERCESICSNAKKRRTQRERERDGIGMVSRHSIRSAKSKPKGKTEHLSLYLGFMHLLFACICVIQARLDWFLCFAGGERNMNTTNKLLRLMTLFPCSQ